MRSWELLFKLGISLVMFAGGRYIGNYFHSTDLGSGIFLIVMSILFWVEHLVRLYKN